MIYILLAVLIVVFVVFSFLVVAVGRKLADQEGKLIMLASMICDLYYDDYTERVLKTESEDEKRDQEA